MRIRSGRFKGRSIRGPASDAVRPTKDIVRQALFNMLRPWMAGARVLDLYAGTGAVGLQAISEGAREVVWVERSHRTAGAVRANVSAVAPEAAGSIVVGDALAYVAKVEGFDIVFADPPYDTPLEPVVAAVLGGAAVTPGGRFVLEHSSRVPAPKAPPGSTLLHTRRHGDSSLSIYAREVDPPPQEGPSTGR